MEPWLPNPNSITKEQLSGLYVDTAAVGAAAMLTALRLVGKNHVVYGADCGVPYSTEVAVEENPQNTLAYEEEKGYRPKRQSVVCRGREEDERNGQGSGLERKFPLRPIGHVGLACFYHFDFIKHVADLPHTPQCPSLLDLPVIHACWFNPLLSTETEVENCQVRPGRISTASTPLLNMSPYRVENPWMSVAFIRKPKDYRHLSPKH